MRLQNYNIRLRLYRQRWQAMTWSKRKRKFKDWRSTWMVWQRNWQESNSRNYHFNFIWKISLTSAIYRSARRHPCRSSSCATFLLRCSGCPTSHYLSIQGAPVVTTQHKPLKTNHSRQTHHSTQTTQHKPLNTNHSTQTTQHKPLNTNQSTQTTQHKPLNTNHSTQTTQHKPLNTNHSTSEGQHGNAGSEWRRLLKVATVLKS